VAKISAAERSRRSAAARAAAIAATRPTTRPGSETTDLQPGDPVRVARRDPGSGTWARYDGRSGWVATVNTQTFPNGRRYVEVGVTWHRWADWTKASAETWFRADEVRLEAL
jgi:hypothetical protein